MKKIVFNDRYTQAVLDGRKTRTIRSLGQFTDFKLLKQRKTEELIEIYALYKIGEEVAVAQSMETLYRNGYVKFASRRELWLAQAKPTWRSKIFVKSDILPHRIKITDVKVVRFEDVPIDEYVECELAQLEDCISAVYPYVFVYDFELVK